MTMFDFGKILLLFTFVSVLFYSCAVTDETPAPTSDPNCSVTAFYRGTSVCQNGENAGAVELESDGGYLILSNFFELANAETIEYGDLITIEYEEVDSAMFSSGILCGALIVAPVAVLTCVSE